LPCSHLAGAIIVHDNQARRHEVDVEVDLREPERMTAAVAVTARVSRQSPGCSLHFGLRVSIYYLVLEEISVVVSRVLILAPC
jgi:hypothetical protein